MMASNQKNQTGMTNEIPSQSALFSQELVSFLSSRGFSGECSLEDVFAALVKDLGDLFEQLSTREAEFNHLNEGNRRTTRSRQVESEEYREILTKKGDLLERITATIEKMNSSPEIPKAKIHCYQKYVALLKERFKNIHQDINMLMEDVRDKKQECERLEQEVEELRMVKEDQENVNEAGEIMQMFQDAKTDLNTVLSSLYTESTNLEFTTAMAAMTDAFMKNDNEEEQYVQLSPETLNNSAMICLIKDNVIIEDRSNPGRFRLNMAE